MIKKHLDLIVLTCILLIAAVIRLWHLGAVPVSLYWDEMAMYVDVKTVLATGKDMHGLNWSHLIYPSYGDYKLAPYLWAAMLSSKFFGLSEWAIRFPSVIAGLISVLMAGLIIKELFPDLKKHNQQLLQWLAMIMVAVMPWSIQFSRTGFEGHLAQSFVAISVWLSLRKKNQLWSTVLAVLFGIAATYTYYSARFVILPLLILIPVVQCIFNSGKLQLKVKFWKQLAMPLFIVTVGFGILIQPLNHANFVTEMNQFRLGTDSILKPEKYILEANKDRELAGNTIVDRVFFHRYWLQLRALLSNVSDHLSLNYLFLSGDPNLRHGTEYFGILLLTTLPFLFIGIWWVGIYRKDIAILLASWWGLALLPASVPTNTPHALRSLNGLLPVALFLAIGAYVLFFDLLPKWTTSYRAKALIGAYAFLIAVNVMAFLIHYFAVYPVISADSWQSGYKPLARELSQIELKHPDWQIQIIPFDDRFYLWLMGYGTYDPHVFSSWQSKGFSFQEALPHVSFKVDVPLAKSDLVVAGKYMLLKEKYPDSELTIINNEVGEPTFAIYQPISLK